MDNDILEMPELDIIDSEPKVSEEKPKKEPWLKDRRNQWILISALIIIALGALVYFGKGLVVASLVNGEPISRLEVISQLEKASGQATLEGLIQIKLVNQAAVKQGIIISEDEINEEFSKIEKNLGTQGTSLDAALAEQGLTRAEIQKRIVTRKQMEKMMGEALNVTDQEVEAYIKDGGVTFNEGTNVAEAKASIRDIIKNTKFSQEAEKLLADLTNKAKINYWVKY